jgi:AmiR/NasT family two-component response regulator
LCIESRGFEVCGEAADGVEGIEKVKELKPDLIVLDYSNKWLTSSRDSAPSRTKHTDHTFNYL